MKRSFIFSMALLLSLSLYANQISEDGYTKRKGDEKIVFLTGAAGFIGSNFLQYMFDKYPNYKFLILDALTYAGNLNNIPKYIRNSERFQFYYGSVTNYQLVDKLMSVSHLVVHFAAESHVTRSILDDYTFFDTDVMGTRAMMTALVKYADTVERFIHISTSETYGTALTKPMTEDHPLNPKSPYAGAKAGADRLVYSYWCTYDVPALIFRPFNNYGPRQHLEKVIPRFVSRAIRREPLTIHGHGLQSRDWVHTYDMSRALDLALHVEDFSKIKNQVINIGSGKSISVLEIAKKILNYFNLPEGEYLTFIHDRPGQVECHNSSTDKSKELLGWETEVDFDKGLKEVIKWYIENSNLWEQEEMMKYVPIYTNGNVLDM
ncbi:dTDP-glucose 4,6-dehydratase [Candidatus Dependentiae bacterium]